MQTASNSASPAKKRRWIFQPAQAWIPILGFAACSVLCILVAPSQLRFAFPILAFAVGFYLYSRFPILYIGFTWWMWFLTPLVARLVDYYSGVWDVQRLMLVSPFLVSLISGITVFRCLPYWCRQEGLPFILAGCSVLYAFAVGCINNPISASARTVLDWLTPILFGFHLLTRWREYPTYRQNLQTIFLWCVLITGVYGVYQYLVAPDWDNFWLVKSGMTSSAGDPEPLGIRVWSTMHSPGPFGIVMMTGLILLFNYQGSLIIPASIFGYLAFLVSLVRTAWGGWIVSLLLINTSLKVRMRRQLVIILSVIIILIVPLTLIEPFAGVLTNRFQTLSNVSEDGSYQIRVQIYQAALESALTNVVGNGLGGGVGDSGPLDLLASLGWIGLPLYVGGITLAVFLLLKTSRYGSDFFMAAARAIPLTILVQLLSYTTTIGLSGMIFWSFIGLGIAGQKYYKFDQIKDNTS